MCVCRRFLANYISKDWHIEGLVGKFCHRMATTTNVGQWRKFVFVLCLFPYSERAFRLADAPAAPLRARPLFLPRVNVTTLLVCRRYMEPCL